MMWMLKELFLTLYDALAEAWWAADLRRRLQSWWWCCHHPDLLDGPTPGVA